jgi:hypothetical protein
MKTIDDLDVPGRRVLVRDDLNMPNDTPLLYQLGLDMRPLTPGGRYLSVRTIPVGDEL